MPRITRFCQKKFPLNWVGWGWKICHFDFYLIKFPFKVGIVSSVLPPAVSRLHPGRPVGITLSQHCTGDRYKSLHLTDTRQRLCCTQLALALQCNVHMYTGATTLTVPDVRTLNQVVIIVIINVYWHKCSCHRCRTNKQSSDKKK